MVENIRTNVGVCAGISTGAVVGEGRILATADQLVVALYGALARRGVGTKPGNESGCAARNTRNVGVGVDGIGLGPGGGGVKSRLLVSRAAVETGPLVVGAGDGEVTGELDLSILNGGVEVLGGAISTDVGEEV